MAGTAWQGNVEIAQSSTSAGALEISHVSKTFGTRRVLDDVSLAVDAGLVHALLGGNGSGKSTLVKSLAGVQPADAGGKITLGGANVSTEDLTPSWAHRHGLRFVHQNPGTFPTMTVAENIAMGHRIPATGGWVRSRTLAANCTDLLERFEIDVSPAATMGGLRLADQTMVAIARALQTGESQDERISVLVLDEPTAALPKEDVEILLGAVRRAARSGVAVIYISHRLDEVLAIADAVTILRDGHVVSSRSTNGLSEEDLVTEIVGRPLSEVFPQATTRPTDSHVVAELRNVSGGPLRDVNLTVQAGEILGIAGLLGSGRSELLGTLFGTQPITAGSIEIDGLPVPLSLRRRSEQRDATDAMTDFRIKAAGPEALMSSLSGGNKQKVVLARWMRSEPKLLLLDEPTQGVDVGARADAYHLVRRAVANGAAVVLVSSDFEELAEMSDRVLILSEGRIAAEARGSDVNRHRLTELVFLARKAARQ